MADSQPVRDIGRGCMTLENSLEDRIRLDTPKDIHLVDPRLHNTAERSLKDTARTILNCSWTEKSFEVHYYRLFQTRPSGGQINDIERVIITKNIKSRIRE